MGVFPGAETVNNLPPVDISDTLSYLVLKTSFISVEKLKARKSLEAYNQFVDVVTRKIAGKYLTVSY